MATPLSKSKIIAHIADKVSTPEKPISKKQAASFFDELFKLAANGTPAVIAQVTIISATWFSMPWLKHK